MANIKPGGPAFDAIEQEFLAALERLQQGKPTRKSLKAANSNGTLKITISNVAFEAGRSRTLISMDKCRYPSVRQRILMAKNGTPMEPYTLTGLVKKLRDEIADLNVKVKQYQAEATAHFLRRTKAEQEAARERAHASRILKEIASSKSVVQIVKK